MRIASVMQRLAERHRESLSEADDPDTDELERLVLTLATSGALNETLLDISRDAEASGELSGRSSWHPLGFAKLHLGLLPRSTVQLRVHLWLAHDSTHAVGEVPHAHRWRFASSVLQGGPLRVVHFEESENGLEFDRYEYGKTGGLRATGRRKLRVVHTLESGLGAFYRCDRGTVHTVRPADPRVPTTTLIARGPDSETSTPVYRLPDEPGSEDRPGLSASELRYLLGRIVSLS